MADVPVLFISRRPNGFSGHSGMDGICRALNIQPIRIAETWVKVQKQSWIIGESLRAWGNRWYGSKWNALIPVWDELSIRHMLPKKSPHIVHWLWGEFASPKRADAYRKRGGRVVVSVHCSARRWQKVWLRPDGYAQADMVVLTSESQREFVERYVPHERVRRILHGVESGFFSPVKRTEGNNKKLRLFLFGNTERDHAFAAAVAKRLPPNRVEWRIRTEAPEKQLYAGIPCVTMLPRLSDEEVREEYRQADLLCMPMLDSAANNVFLESMSCGTPVMTNRVGGVPEYVAEPCNVLMPANATVDDWADHLLAFEQDRKRIESMRLPTRMWAEHFDWALIAKDYLTMYHILA